MRSVEKILREVESVPDYYGHKATSVHYKNGWGETPLHIVSCWGDCEAINTLIEAGADINAPGEYEFTPLHYAVEQNHPEAVALLLALGAKNLRDREGYTPMALAELLDRDEIIKLFAGGIIVGGDADE